MERRTLREESLTPQALRWSWVLVIVCGLLLGYYFLRTYGQPLHRQYQLDFGAAKWIEPPEKEAPEGYFRKEIYLSSLPEEAWIEIAGSDNFGLFVNGRTLGDVTSEKSYITGIYDMKHALHIGTNVVAVSVSRTSYPAPAQMLLRAQITESGGAVKTILSDETWRAANRTGIVMGSEDWKSHYVEDELWPKARLSPLNTERVSLRWVDVNPRLLQLPPIGHWIMSENASPQSVFSTSIRAEDDKQETWIQVASSSGALDLAVNGNLITVASTAVAGSKTLPHLAEATPTPTPNPGEVAEGEAALPPQKGSPFTLATLSAYDISYWIKRGSNSIVAAVRSDSVPAALFANGFTVGTDGNVQRFSSGAAWWMGAEPEVEHTGPNPHPIEIGKDGTAPWGYLPQELGRPLDRSGLATFVKSWTIVLLTLGLVVAIWLIVSAFVAGWRKEPLTNAMSRDALLHGPVAVALLFLWLPNFDPRFPEEWSFRPVITVGALAVLLLLRLTHLFVGSWTPAMTPARVERAKKKANWELRKNYAREVVSSRLRLPQLFEIPFARFLPYLILVVILFLGFSLRYHNLGDMSFDHDEMGLVSKSNGVFKLGFPYTMFAGEVRWITTYEAVPYPLAVSGKIFGYSEWSMRFPACLMATMCIGVIALMGRRLFDWRTGLIAAFIYACLPLNIRWGQNAFYPSQCQLMAVLTFWLFYEAIRLRPFHRKFLTAAAVAFCLSYLSWEGTGFILPALFLGLFAIRWGEWWWLKQFHLYRCLFFMGAVVVAQYCSRMIAGASYLQVGSGLSNLTGPSLFFLAPGYQPMFYVDKLLLSENHVFFTLMILVGLPFCWRHLGFRYIIVSLATLFVLHTNFLAALSPRYCYYFQPLVIMGGVAATIMLYDRVLALTHQAGDSGIGRLAAHATGIGLLVLLFVQSNESVMKEYLLSSTGDAPEMMTRMGTYRYDYRGAAHYVMDHARAGDVILPGIPHVFDYYAGMNGNYFLDTLFSSKVPYDQTFDEPRFADKFSGLAVIRNVTELRDVVSRAGRVWVVFAPYASFEKLDSPAVLDYIHKNGKTEFESYRAKVMLIQAAQTAPTVAQSP